MFRFLATLALIAVPAQAEMLSGADDPAFLAALTTLLAQDDPTAVAAMRDLAEAGNTAALVTLPLALQWVPPVGNLKEKNAQRTVRGVKALEAAAQAHAATALWDMGQVDDPMDLPDRAKGLLALEESEKAAVLLSAWVNQTGDAGEFLPHLMNNDVPAMLGAFALTARLRDAFYSDGGGIEAASLLLSLMREDELAAWIAYVIVSEGSTETSDRISSLLAGTGLNASDTEAKIEAARAVRAVWGGFASDEVPTPAATAALARAALIGRAELLPVTRLCQAQCPDTPDTCETAALVYQGLQFGHGGWQPFADVLDPMAFAASDRGLFTLIRAREDPAAAADRATAEGLDACYAGVLARRDQISLRP
jgi:hypothetical protein